MKHAENNVEEHCSSTIFYFIFVCRWTVVQHFWLGFFIISGKDYTFDWGFVYFSYTLMVILML